MDYKAAFIIMCSNDKEAYNKLTVYNDPTKHYIQGCDLPLRLYCYDNKILTSYIKSKKIGFSIKPQIGSGESIYRDIKNEAWLYYDINNIINIIFDHPDHEYNYDYEEKYRNTLENKYPEEVYFTKVAMLISAKRALDDNVAKNVPSTDAVSRHSIIFKNDICLNDLFLTICSKLFDDFKPTVTDEITYARMSIYFQKFNFENIKDIITEVKRP